MATCCQCGKWHSREEWPAEDIADYTASMCYKCYKKLQQESIEQEDEPEPDAIDPSEDELYPDVDDGCEADPEDEEDE